MTMQSRLTKTEDNDEELPASETNDASYSGGLASVKNDDVNAIDEATLTGAVGSLFSGCTLNITELKLQIGQVRK